MRVRVRYSHMMHHSATPREAASFSHIYVSCILGAFPIPDTHGGRICSALPLLLGGLFNVVMRNFVECGIIIIEKTHIIIH